MWSVKASVNGRLRRSVNRFWASFFILGLFFLASFFLGLFFLGLIFFMGQNSKRLKKKSK